MNTDRLQKLLNTADAEVSMMPPRDLVRRVFRRRALRRRRNIAVGTAAGLLIMVVGSQALLRPITIRPNASARHDPSPAAARVELARFAAEAEVDARLAIVDRMLALEARRAAQNEQVTSVAHALPPDPLDEVRAQVTRAAATLVRHADRLKVDYGLPQRAMETYRETIRLFPETAWARVARQQLEAMQTDEGDTL